MRKFPPGWAWARFDDVAAWGSGGTPRTGVPDYYDGDIPWVVIGDMDDGPLSLTARNISRAGLDSSSAKVVSSNAVLIAMYGSIGKLALPTVPVSTNQAIAFAEPYTQVVDRRYLYLFLMHQRPEFNAAGRGGTQQNISQAVLKRWPIALPPVAEQRRIVLALDDSLASIERGVASIEAQLNRLRRCEEAILLEMLDSSIPHRSVARLLKRRPSNGRSVPSARNGFPVLRLTALRKGWAVELSERKTGAWTLEQAEPYLVRKGDVLLSRGNGSIKLVGRAALVVDEPDPVAYPDTMIRLEPNNELIDSRYLVAVWNSRIVRDQIEEAARTTAGIHKINQTIVERIHIPLPSAARQQEIAAQFDEGRKGLGRLRTALEQGREHAARLSRSLLDAAVHGVLVDQDPNDEPAEVALAQLGAEREAATTKKTRRSRPQKATSA